MMYFDFHGKENFIYSHVVFSVRKTFFLKARPMYGNFRTTLMNN